ncbi:MAG: hypothetical protein JSS30_05510 [Verrucomicrobia bacterium]|nr:hypothetical protein [Verrucomicrobiota bacterium]
MSAAINHPVADATTGAFDQVKSGVIDVANWLGRQVTWLVSSLKTIVERIIEAVKPVFASLVEFVRDQAVKLKDLIASNQSVAITLAVAVPAVALFTILGSYLFCGKEAKKEEVKPAVSAPAPAATKDAKKV